MWPFDSSATGQFGIMAGLSALAMKGGIYLGSRLSGVAQESRSNAMSLVESHCQRLGLKISKRNGDNILLSFEDPVIQNRKVMITCGNNLAVFVTLSAISFPAGQVRVELLDHLLERNAQQLVGGWQTVEVHTGRTAFALKYCCFTNGLQAHVLKAICDAMVKECQEFDLKLKSDGIV